MTGIEAVCAGGTLLSLAHLAWAQRCFRKWADASPPSAPSAAEPAITFLRPLKRGVPGLREKLVAHARALREDDQLILGVEADSAEAALSEEVRTAFPEHEIVVVSCEAKARSSRNPKVARLLAMTPHARHEHLVTADSEATLTADFLAAWRAEWAATGADVLTAGYRLDGSHSWPQRLDAAAVLVTLWPGLAVLHSARSLRLTLGACTALRRADLAAVGGWIAFADELAEDNRLGAALAAAGRSIRLSPRVLALAADPLTWRDWWRHQCRVAVTYRASSPWGFLGSIVTHGEMWALGLVAAGHPWGLACFFAHWAARVACARAMAGRLGFALPGLPLAVLGASLAAGVGWALSWGTRRVWWGGRRWRVSFRGKLGEI